jgi:glucose-6-phosphate dehydrogenase assembly protein OpcA
MEDVVTSDMNVATSISPATIAISESVPLDKIEQELNRLLIEAHGPDEPTAHRAHMSNLVIFCATAEAAEHAQADISAVVALHPARVLLLVGERLDGSGDVQARVSAWCRRHEGMQQICSEQVTLNAGGPAVARLPFAVRGLLIGDLPTNLWWATNQPPPLAGPILYDLTENIQQIIYDSIGWPDPARGVAATANWLTKFELGPGGQLRGRVASDLNWRRIKYWQRIMAQALDPALAPEALTTISEVLIEHGPHAVVQAWQLASWLAACLNWKVQTAHVQPNEEISWKLAAPHGSLQLRIRRLPAGPAEVRRVRIACKLDGQARALDFQWEDEFHLAVALEGVEAAKRTITIQRPALAELVGRQLSDRERDPRFYESMSVARLLANNVLGLS